MEQQLELFPELSESALDKAKRIIYGDREKTYGNPSRNLQAVAEMWMAYLAVKLDKAHSQGDWRTWQLNAKDVCAMMGLLKTARFANDPGHDDNIVDAIGYWALVERCDENT